jgi:alpha-tubulin suppressor-like RCC1 family protein
VSDRTVKCWGNNLDGQLGIGSSLDTGRQPSDMGDNLLPAQLQNSMSSAEVVAAGDYHSCATFETGALMCWGYNEFGQLGLGDTASRGQDQQSMQTLESVDLGNGRSAKSVSGGATHTCALLDDNTIKCWGSNQFGQLGVGSTTDYGMVAGDMASLPPVDLGAGRTAKSVSAGGTHTCAVLDNNQVKCWGSNEFGQLGLGDTLGRGSQAGQMGDALPSVDLGVGRSAQAVAAGKTHTCALLDDASVKCWGLNDVGQLGLGDTAARGPAVGQMGDSLPAVDLGLSVRAMATGASALHTCALLDDETIKCWGLNDVGQLGLNDTDNRGDQPGEMGVALKVADIWPPSTGNSAQ